MKFTKVLNLRGGEIIEAIYMTNRDFDDVGNKALIDKQKQMIDNLESRVSNCEDMITKLPDKMIELKEANQCQK